tara:strand:- start:5843 stop:6289 length:447 start_codon:yes stop_codon:yes gene_type:complete
MSEAKEDLILQALSALQRKARPRFNYLSLLPLVLALIAGIVAFTIVQERLNQHISGDGHAAVVKHLARIDDRLVRIEVPLAHFTAHLNADAQIHQTEAQKAALISSAVGPLKSQIVELDIRQEFNTEKLVVIENLLSELNSFIRKETK